MTRSRLGMMFGIAGAAVATWWFSRRDYVTRGMSEAGRGEVIFRNTPVAP